MGKATSEIPATEREKQLAAEAKLATFRKEIAAADEAEAKAEKQLAETKKAARDAERDALKGPDIKALEGKITATGNFIETTILVNKAMVATFEKLVEKLKANATFKSGSPNFIIYNQADFPAVDLYISMIQQLTAFSKVYEDVAGVAVKAMEDAAVEGDNAGGAADPLMIGFAAASVIRTAADIFSLFKSNTAYNNYEIANDEAQIVTCFSSVVSQKGFACKIYFPAVFPVHLINTNISEPASDFVTLLTKVKGLNNSTVSLQIKMETELASIEEKLMTEQDVTKKVQLQNRKQELNKVLAPLQRITSTFSQLETLLSTLDPATKMTTYAMIVRAERLAALLKKSNTYVIKFLAKSSGSTRVKESLFRSSEISHTGGTQLSCLIFAEDGSIIFSDNHCEYIPNKASSEIVGSNTVKQNPA